MNHVYSSRVTTIKLKAAEARDADVVLEKVFEWVKESVATVSLKTKPQVLVDYRSIIKMVNGHSGNYCSAAVIKGVIAGNASHTHEKYLLLEVEAD